MRSQGWSNSAAYDPKDAQRCPAYSPWLTMLGWFSARYQTFSASAPGRVAHDVPPTGWITSSISIALGAILWAAPNRQALGTEM
ncbi:MAG: hypothetical protein ACRDTG_16650 [Pseudonocardiaceae bacterium]